MPTLTDISNILIAINSRIILMIRVELFEYFKFVRYFLSFVISFHELFFMCPHFNIMICYLGHCGAWLDYFRYQSWMEVVVWWWMASKEGVVENPLGVGESRGTCFHFIIIWGLLGLPERSKGESLWGTIGSFLVVLRNLWATFKQIIRL